MRKLIVLPVIFALFTLFAAPALAGQEAGTLESKLYFQNWGQSIMTNAQNQTNFTELKSLFETLSKTGGKDSSGTPQEKVDVYKNQQLVKSVVFQIGLKKYFVNGQLPGYDIDVAPFIQEPENRTFVPVRYLAKALGVAENNICWDDKTQKVTMTDPGFPKVEMTIDVPQVLSDGKPVPGVDAAPVIVPPGRTMLPARFTAQALGFNVKWDDKLNLVICWKGDPDQEPDISAVRAELANWEWNETGYRLPKKDGALIDQKLSAKYSNGVYWTKAGLKIDPSNNGGKDTTDLGLLINALDDGGTLEAYDQAEAILASRFGQEFAGEVMAYARQKKTRFGSGLMNQEKWYLTPTGQWLRVSFGEGTNITVYVPPGFRPYWN